MKYAISNLLTSITTYVLFSSSTNAPLQEITPLRANYEVAPAVIESTRVSSKYFISFHGDSATTKVVRDTIKSVDTLKATSDISYTFSRYFEDSSDLINFCKYIKTQSYNLDDDTRAVIRVMFNRLEHYECDWQTYYRSPLINNSKTIASMRSKARVVPFSLSNKYDSELYEMVKAAFNNPIRVPTNVLYFESHPTCPNKGCFKKAKMWRKIVHKFYTG
jgi:hypothetical protein